MITWAWKARGWPTDNAYISRAVDMLVTPPPGASPKARKPSSPRVPWPKRSAPPSSAKDGPGTPAPVDAVRSLLQGTGAAPRSALGLRPGVDAASAFPTWSEVTEAFLPPLSHVADRRRALLLARAQARREAGAPPDWLPVNPIGTSATPAEVCAELAQPFTLRTGDVRTACTAFAKACPVDTVVSRLPPGEGQWLAQVLAGPAVGRLVGLCSLLGYLACICPAADPTVTRAVRAAMEASVDGVLDEETFSNSSPERRDQVTAAAHAAYEPLLAACRQSRARTALCLPLVIVEVKACVDVLLREAFPRWFVPRPASGTLPHARRRGVVGRCSCPRAPVV